MLESNNAVEAKLKEKTKQDEFTDMVLPIFATLNKQELFDFIKVRRYVGSKANRNETYRLPKNKGKLEKAERGVVNLIRAAYDARELEIIRNGPTVVD